LIFLEKLGALLFLLGLGCVGFALFEFFTVDMFEMPRYDWLPFIGIPLMFLGFVLSGARIQRFLLRQQKENIRETMKIMGEGLREGLESHKTYCPNCGNGVDTLAKFCSNCGTQLVHKEKI
jgi:ribosomal protein S27AE